MIQSAKQANKVFVLLLAIGLGLAGLDQLGLIQAQTATVTSTRSILIVDTVADLANLTPIDGTLVRTKGYSTDGVGSALYRYHKTGRSGITANSVTYFNGGASDDYFELEIADDVIDVTMAGAVGNGIADDTEAIQAVATALQLNGGFLRFPVPGIYKVTDEITLTSDYPISIISQMGPHYEDGNTGSHIAIGGTITGSVFKVNAPGGIIRGLYFKDPSGSIPGATQGTRSVDSCLELELFSMGKVVDCAFDGIKGSCIKSARWIRGYIVRLHARDCGDTGKPSIDLSGTSAESPTQGVVITAPHMEVCRSAPYIYLNEHAPNTKIIGGQFEGDESVASSNQYFIHSEANTTVVSQCAFTVNTSSSLVLDGPRALVESCSFEGEPGDGEAKLKVSGSFCQISNSGFWGTADDDGVSIIDTGGNNFFTGNHVYFGGNVQLGSSTTWTGGGIYDLKTAENYCLVCNTDSTVSGVFISGADTAGGIYIPSAASVTGCIVLSNAGIGIRCQSSTATINGNRCSGNSGGDLSFTAYPHGYHPNSNYAGDGSYPLQASTTWDPGSLADGASASQNITVTGAVSGDVALAQFPTLASASGQNGIQISSSVYSNNTVKVTITNNSGGVVDLDSGTLVVKVVKQ